MTSGQRKVLMAVGGLCAIAVGVDTCQKTKKLELGNAARILGGVVAVLSAIT
jgi:hypothetical protein